MFTLPKEQLLADVLPAAVVVWGMIMHAMNSLKITVTVERR